MKIYINDVAAENPKTFPAGSIVVKEVCKKKDESTTRAVTVMKRIEGYNPNYAGCASIRAV